MTAAPPAARDSWQCAAAVSEAVNILNTRYTNRSEVNCGNGDRLRAWRIEEFNRPDGLRYAEVDDLHPGEGMVRVRVGVSSVNHIDRLVIGGRFSWVPLPRTPGSEFVGTVEEIGEGTPAVSVGDRVAVFPKMFCGKCRYCLMHQEGICLSGWNPSRAPVDLSTNMLPLSMDGGWADQAVVPARNAVVLPDGLSFDRAFGIPLSATTAWHAIERSRAAEGEIAVVMGATGGVGLFALQILKLKGCRVIAVSGNESLSAKLREAGADAVCAGGAELNECVTGIGGERGADVIVDFLGQSTFRQSVSLLAPGGRYVTGGTLTGNSGEIDLLRLYSRQIEIIGSTTGSIRDLAAAAAACAAGKIRTFVDSEFGLEEIPDAIRRHSEHGRFGKVKIRVE